MRNSPQKKRKSFTTWKDIKECIKEKPVKTVMGLEMMLLIIWMTYVSLLVKKC